ncbi:uncharacterized protein FOMMEDRAFT_170574 [Fomitiporia mediterranea MF3/22]|uniref:uncharacterized protein n=1 Tax=Fomitiporia mediterranea (strain MF3/22) TaxID=694068 RepID=UPI00044075CB|nr:uncharacterized protein FOMMEDRAFT_170574 [Fomitiporia mediterranea MF3/22]EJC99256.1 hypothetical protein FOMMEDRAFT_170574 [Fomitiporia mediterranea MF3/22]
MSYYQQQHYGPPTPAAPINSSFYAARQHFEQQPQASVLPPHLRANAPDYRNAAPPRHPAQQGRMGGQHQPTMAGPSQGRPVQAQVGQQYARPQSQYGQVQPYQPPYTQTQMQMQGAPRQPSYMPPGQYSPQPEFNMAQYTQRMYGYPPIPMQPQMMSQPSPARAFALYEAYNARTQHAAAAQQQAEQQQQQQRRQPPSQAQSLHQTPQPQTPQTQFARPVVSPQMAPSTSAPPDPRSPQSQPQSPSGTRRPLPQPGQQSRPRPMSMPPQAPRQILGPQKNSYNHSPSGPQSNIVPQSVGVPPASYSCSSSSPSAHLPSNQDTRQATDIHVPRTLSPEKMPEKSSAETETTNMQRTPTQRRALPPSPTAPPDLTQLRNRRSVVSPTLSPVKPVSSNSVPQQLTQQATAPSHVMSDSEDDDRLSAVSQTESQTSEVTSSPQYGILDLPNRNSRDVGTKVTPQSPQYGIKDLPNRTPRVIAARPDPQSPQYGIKNLPTRTKSVVDRRKAWERAEQGMNEALARSKPASPTKQSLSNLTRSTAPVPARSPQPQTPLQPQKLPMPVVRQPQPSRTERTPSWTLPTADLDKVNESSEKKTSLALRLATMSLEEENGKTKSQPVTPTTRTGRPVTQRSATSQSTSPTKPYPFLANGSRRRVNMDLSLDDAPPPSLRRTPSPSASTSSSSAPSIPTIKTPEDVPHSSAPSIPQISLPGGLDLDDVVNSTPSVKVHVPAVVVSPKPTSPRKANIPLINLPGNDEDLNSSGPAISVSAPSPLAHAVSMPVILDDLANPASQTNSRGLPKPPDGDGQIPMSSSSSRSRGGGLVCGGCHESIIGRIVSAMGLRWHPQCFRCCVCGEHLEHVSSYEHESKPYCHLDYHELFAPQCYSCKTPIIDERFITLDDPALGKRTYHEQHFFCAECGDPFLAPSPAKSYSKRSGPNEINIKGDGAFDVALDEDGEEVGFTVFRGHPYCEACHGCQKPFEEPSFFQRDKKPFSFIVSLGNPAFYRYHREPYTGGPKSSWGTGFLKRSVS